MKTDNTAELGRLIEEHLRDTGMGPAEFAATLPGVNLRTFYGWKSGERAPYPRVHRVLEDALGWERDSVDKVLKSPQGARFTLSELRDWSKLEDPSVARAADLSTDELLMELTRRVGVMAAELESYRSTSQSSFGLAASDDHVPGEDDMD